MTARQAQLAVLQRHGRDRIKLADLSARGDDVPFEQAFSSLAHSYLRDKSPGLLDYEQGFQMLDRNEESTKAVGVIGFKVGSQQLYAPVFFLQGDLKGHELLYLKNQDLFCPNAEAWLNDILNKKPNILGQGVTRNTGQLGGQAPSLDRLNRSPLSKYSSAVASFFREALPGLAHAAVGDHRQPVPGLDFGGFLKEASLDTLETVVETARTYPWFGQAIVDFYGDDLLPQAVKTAGAKYRAERTSSVLDVTAAPRVTGSVLDEPPKTAALKVLTYDLTVPTDQPDEISDEDREKLLKDEILIKDDRGDDDVSIPYRTEVAQKLFNPTHSGLYMVLVKPGKFSKCYVACAAHGPNGRETFATIVRLEGDKDWLNIHPSRIFCGAELDPDEYDSWFEGLPDAGGLSGDESSRQQVLVGPDADGTVPFRVRHSQKSDADACLVVSFSSYAQRDVAEHLMMPRDRADHNYPSDNSWCPYVDGERVHVDCARGSSLHSNQGDLYVPTGYKLLKIEPAKDDETGDDQGADADAGAPEHHIPGGDGGLGDDPDTVKALDGREPPPNLSGSQNMPFQLGNIVDAHLLLTTKTAGLKLAAFDGGYRVNGRQFPRLGALKHLVVEHGFREKTARHLLENADRKRVFECLVKYAAGSPFMTDDGPSAPSFPEPRQGGGEFMGYQGSSETGQQERVPVDQLSSSHTDRDAQRPQAMSPYDMQSIQRAVDTGQKDVFDVASLGSMLKSVRDDTMIDRYIPDLVKGMDRLGRILFQFYWHGDQFAERYGKTDMPDLEDALRNAFEDVSDVIIFLKMKSVEPYPEEGAVSLDLGKAAN